MANEIANPLVPFPRSYWVLPGRLLAGEYPGHILRPHAAEKLGRLLDAGIRTCIDLTEAHETNWTGQPFMPYQEIAQSLAVERGEKVRCVRHPIRDCSVPSSMQMIAILDELDASLAAERPVYIHCWGGIGRTGTVVGCWLSRHEIARGTEALALIAKLRMDEPTRHRVSPETPEQRDMVTTWSET